MPVREVPIITNEYYHVFNKTIDSRIFFDNNNTNNHFFDLVRYYQSLKATVSYSRLSSMTQPIRENLIRQTELKTYFKVNILSYCFMPTHFHFLIKQKTDYGIERLISDTTNAITRFYNLKNDRIGPIFLPRFKAVRIVSYEQLIHVSRYIHLNPFSSSIIQDVSELKSYIWSSYRELVTSGVEIENGLCDRVEVLKLFGMNQTKYMKFVEENADYQKSLEYVKHAKEWV